MDNVTTAGGKCASSRQYSAAVNVQDLSSNEARMLGAKKEDGSGDLFRLAHTAEGNGREYFVPSLGIVKRRSSHLGCHPSWRHAIHVDAVAGKLGAQALHQADDRPLAGCVIGVEGFASLSRSGADEYDAARRRP